MEMPVKLMTADPRVKQNIGKRAIQRGPLVYCMEEVDNPQDFDNLKIAANTSFNAQFNPKLLNGITTIKPLRMSWQSLWSLIIHGITGKRGK